MIARNALHSRQGSFKDRRGVAMVEFALTLPMLMLLYLGSVQLTSAMSCYRKLGATGRFVADLISQDTATTPGEINYVLQAAQVIMAPYASKQLTVRVTSIKTDQTNLGTVQWSSALNGTALRRGTIVSVPEGLAPGDRFLIYVETSYQFRLLGPLKLFNPVLLADRFYMSPRQSRQVACDTCG